MAIAKVVRPNVIVAGEVVRISERRRKNDQTLYAHEVVIAQENGAQVGVIVYQRDNGDNIELPQPGSFFAAECTIEESREFGASLNFDRWPFDQLDRITSALAAA